MKRAPRSRQRHDLYAKYHDYDSEISDLLGECGFNGSAVVREAIAAGHSVRVFDKLTYSGFCTLTENVEFLYKVSAPYSAAHDRGVAWDHPHIAVGWPVAPGAVVLSDKDRTWPALRDLERVFEREAA